MKKIIAILLLVTLSAVALCAGKDKPKPITAEELIKRANAIYYVPALSTARCELVVPFIQNDAELNSDGNLKFYYSYTAPNVHDVTIEGLSEERQTLKATLLNLLQPIAESAFPQSPTLDTDNRKVEIIKTQKRIVDRKSVPYYLVMSYAERAEDGSIANPNDIDVALLINEDGLIDRFDYYMPVPNSTSMTVISYGIENVKTDFGYLFKNMIAKAGSYYQDEEIEYGVTNGFMLPTRYEKRLLNNYNRVDTANGTLQVFFKDWIAIGNWGYVF